jgi:serine/threonine protein kinase
MVALTTGTIVDDRFEIIDELGQGGMGVVYRARQLQMDRTIALKVLREQVSGDIDRVKRFKREAQLASVLEHPNIVQVFGVGIASNDLPYIAMEFLSGSQLDEVLEKNGPMPWRELLPLMMEVCDALQYAHSQNIIHRDIKPSNIMIADNHAKVVDFGIAKSLSDASPKLTQTNVLMGSVYYMSPSDFSGAPATAQSDIYALGCTIFEMLVGKPPFAGDTVFDTMTKHALEPIPGINQLNAKANIPDSLQRVVDWMLAKEPADRASSAAEVKEKLHAVLTGETVNLQANQIPIAKIHANRKLIVAIAMFFGISMVAVSLYLFYHPTDGTSVNSLHMLTSEPREIDLVSAVKNAPRARRTLAYQKLGSFYLANGKDGPALACFTKGLSLAANDNERAQLENLIGYVYLSVGKYQRAEEFFQASRDRNLAKNGTAQGQTLGLIKCYAAEGRTDLVTTTFEQIVPAIQAREQGIVSGPAEACILLMYGIEGNIRQKNFKRAAELVTMLEQFAREKHLDQAQVRAFRLLLKGKNHQRIDDTEIQAAQAGIVAEPTYTLMLLAWATAKQRPKASVEFCAQSLQKLKELRNKGQSAGTELRACNDMERLMCYVYEAIKSKEESKTVDAMKFLVHSRLTSVSLELTSQREILPVDVKIEDISERDQQNWSVQQERGDQEWTAQNFETAWACYNRALRLAADKHQKMQSIIAVGHFVIVPEVLEQHATELEPLLQDALKTRASAKQKHKLETLLGICAHHNQHWDTVIAALKDQPWKDFGPDPRFLPNREGKLFRLCKADLGHAYFRSPTPDMKWAAHWLSMLPKFDPKNPDAEALSNEIMMIRADIDLPQTHRPRRHLLLERLKELLPYVPNNAKEELDAIRALIGDAAYTSILRKGPPPTDDETN